MSTATSDKASEAQASLAVYEKKLLAETLRLVSDPNLPQEAKEALRNHELVSVLLKRGGCHGNG